MHNTYKHPLSHTLHVRTNHIKNLRYKPLGTGTLDKTRVSSGIHCVARYLRQPRGTGKYARGSVRVRCSSELAVGGLVASPGLARWHQGPGLRQLKGTLSLSS